MSMAENPSTVLFLISDTLKAVRVNYDGGNGNHETVKKTFLTDLSVGDFVLVETDTRWGAAVCKIVAVNVEVDFQSSAKIGWVFSKIDLAELDRLKEEETRALTIITEARKRKAKQELRETIMSQCGDELKALPSYSATKSAE